MGAVWVARNLALDVQVALKLIRSDVDSPGAGDRLLTEARAAARLKHPAIVRIFDFGQTHHGDPFIVMEMLTGENLGEVLDREGQLSAVTAVQLLLPIADGLAVAHANGVIHRDIKPENFFITDTEGRIQPKVLDFGIAKLEQQADGKVTQAGTILGSPDYMSPEQARGDRKLDHRCDVWAFAIVLYECVWGQVPFEETNYNALLRRIIEEPVRPLLSSGLIDEDLWQIIEKGLRKDREERYSSMREFGLALAGWLIDHGVNEDACGQSLRATWIDPRASIADGTILRNTLTSISRTGQTPPRLTPQSSLPISGTPSSTRSALSRNTPVTQPALPPYRPLHRWLGIAGGAAAILVLATVGFLVFGRADSAPQAPASSSAVATSPAPAASSAPSAPDVLDVDEAAGPQGAASEAAVPEAEPSGDTSVQTPAAVRAKKTGRTQPATKAGSAQKTETNKPAGKSPTRTYEDFGF